MPQLLPLMKPVWRQVEPQVLQKLAGSPRNEGGERCSQGARRGQIATPLSPGNVGAHCLREQESIGGHRRYRMSRAGHPRVERTDVRIQRFRSDNRADIVRGIAGLVGAHHSELMGKLR